MRSARSKADRGVFSAPIRPVIEGAGVSVACDGPPVTGARERGAAMRDTAHCVEDLSVGSASVQTRRDSCVHILLVLKSTNLFEEVRVPDEVEQRGIDRKESGEEAFTFATDRSDKAAAVNGAGSADRVAERSGEPRGSRDAVVYLGPGADSDVLSQAAWRDLGSIEGPCVDLRERCAGERRHRPVRRLSSRGQKLRLLVHSADAADCLRAPRHRGGGR